MRRKIIVLILIFMSSILAIRVYLYFATTHQYKSGEVIDFETTVLSEPKTVIRGQQLSIILPSGQRVLVIWPQSPVVSYGDTISLKGKLKSVRSGPLRSGSAGASEKSFLALSYPQISVKSDGKNPVLAVTASLRHEIDSFYDRYLPPVSASLLLGIVFGIKENIPQDFSILLKNSGVTHVIAASGMNISMVAGFFAVAFSAFLKRKLAIVFTVVAICFYALFSGLEPSIVRAAIMGIIAFSAQLLGRQNTSIFALLITGFVMIFISPILIFDVGFQLSLFSTIGILLLNPILMVKISSVRFLKIIEGDLATTLSAQVFTLPLILATFGSYSLISVLVNILVLWTIPIIMVLGGLGALMGLVFAPLGVLVLYLLYPFLYYFELVVRSLGSLGLNLNISSLPVSISLGYYLILASIIVKMKQKKT